MNTKTRLLTTLFLCVSIFCQAKKALLVIAHGSPNPTWNKPAIDLESRVSDTLKARGIKDFAIVRTALMEYTHPNISEVVKDLEREQVDTIFAMPIFICPSSHTEEDIPNLLGHKYNSYIREGLVEEHAEFVKTRIPITMGPTFMFSDVCEKITLHNVQQLSKNPKDEALIILAHGDEAYMPFWKELIESIDSKVRRGMGFDYSNHAFVEMGQEFVKDALPIIKEAAKHKKRIILQGVYLTSGIKGMAQRFGLIKAVDEALAGQNVEVVYGDKGLLPDGAGEVSGWIVDCAQQWLDR
ncbi:sirohydrochlorin cobaltochelatase [Prevotella sp. DNF00663]|uniref:sirohydrochlorin chelatase n=1 Tax=Prevotella sp. DNF00663 TaxID=1384078 RepID=UPI000783380E|nr:CbiX/SirB N-terminal domain-containing protein [Prevotella sp. DNF00663]KXB85365.1 sirohydrochlorin cobaltochelatase [Prevotella sp. DNF00663]